MEQIQAAVNLVGTDRLLLAHATSTYPCPKEELNLRMITTLREMFDCPIGYSGHEVGLATTVAAVALGACFVERHITLDRAMWGSDQAAVDRATRASSGWSRTFAASKWRWATAKSGCTTAKSRPPAGCGSKTRCWVRRST